MRPTGIHALLDRDRPEAVVHAAAWTDVDGCAREPELARRRNADAVHVLAEATAARGIDLVHVSTNEVFDGRRTDGHGYAADDATHPINPYGESKLAGEIAAIAAYRGRPAHLGIVRTAWLYGPPGNDFPSKILAAAERSRAAGEALRVVGDEHGSPTFTHDVAEAVADLLGSGDVSGVHHVVNGGVASRAELGARAVPQGRRRRDHRGGARVHVAARLDAAGVGRPRADAAAERRAAPDLAGRARRLRAVPAPRQGAAR